MEKKNTLLLTVIAVATLLVAVVGATFAYFGSFSVNNTSRTNVSVGTDEAVGSSLVTTGASIKLHVLGKEMTYDPNNAGSVAVGTNEEGTTDTGNLTVKLDASSNATITTCTYDIVYAYDAGADRYGNGERIASTGVKGKEFTYKYSLMAGTNKLESEPTTDGADGVWMAKDVDTEMDFVEFANAVEATPVVVGKGKISTKAGASSATNIIQQGVNFTVKFYNFPSIVQDQLANGNYNGAFYTTNEKCSSVARS